MNKRTWIIIIALLFEVFCGFKSVFAITFDAHDFEAFKNATAESNIDIQLFPPPLGSYEWNTNFEISGNNLRILGGTGDEFVIFDGDNFYMFFMTITKNISFTGNFIAQHFSDINNHSYGLLYIRGNPSTNGNINFTNSTFTFMNNKLESGVQAAGGVISVGIYSTIDFTSSVIKFIDNTSIGKNGTAISVAGNNANVNFTSSTIDFTHNTSDVNGGAIYIYNRANLNSANSTVNFTNNEADSGGAIFADYYSNIHFSMSWVNFISNVSIGGSGEGGAIFATHDPINNNNTNINFTSSVVNFINNTAPWNGGAIQLRNGSKSNFTNSKVAFISNTVQRYGGAISLSNSLTNMSYLNSAVDFISNRANTEGEQFMLLTMQMPISQIRQSLSQGIRQATTEGRLLLETHPSISQALRSISRAIRHWSAEGRFLLPKEQTSTSQVRRSNS